MSGYSGKREDDRRHEKREKKKHKKGWHLLGARDAEAASINVTVSLGSTK